MYEYKKNQCKTADYSAVLFMDFSLLSPLEFFVDPKNGDWRRKFSLSHIKV